MKKLVNKQYKLVNSKYLIFTEIYRDFFLSG